MSIPIKHIVCPHCQNEIKVEEAISEQMDKELQLHLAKHKNQLNSGYEQKMKELVAQQKAFEDKKKKENELFSAKLEKEKNLLKESLQVQLQEQFRQKLDSQNHELKQLMNELGSLRKKEIELEKLRRKMDLQRGEIELEYEKKMYIHQKDVEANISRRIYEEMEMKMREKDKKLQDQRKLIVEMQRKANQGSVQLQGEVQELAIEEWLASQFPFDEIQEIKKGVRGADCLQIVNTREHQNCGSIYYESKRTKEFNPGWLDKFKQDMIQSNADLGVLVTQSYPKDMERMGERYGIWICSFEEFKSLSYILRQMLIKLHEGADVSKNKGEKMVMLYDYLASNEFKLKIESIVEGFTAMNIDLQKEKNAMFRIWKQREKQIQRVLINTTEMYGELKGIAGHSIPNIRQLELPIGDNEVFDLKNETSKNDVSR